MGKMWTDSVECSLLQSRQVRRTGTAQLGRATVMEERWLEQNLHEDSQPCHLLFTGCYNCYSNFLYYSGSSYKLLYNILPLLHEKVKLKIFS